MILNYEDNIEDAVSLNGSNFTSASPLTALNRLPVQDSQVSFHRLIHAASCLTPFLFRFVRPPLLGGYTCSGRSACHDATLTAEQLSNNKHLCHVLIPSLAVFYIVHFTLYLPHLCWRLNTHACRSGSNLLTREWPLHVAVILRLKSPISH